MNLDSELTDKVNALQNALLVSHPQMPSLLRTIHKQLKDDPACVTLLTEEQISVIVSGLKQITKTELITASLKKPGTKALKNTNVDDL